MQEAKFLKQLTGATHGGASRHELGQAERPDREDSLAAWASWIAMISPNGVSICDRSRTTVGKRG
eukprot:10245742-Prorocentrum_lima.AAC.1